MSRIGKLPEWVEPNKDRHHLAIAGREMRGRPRWERGAWMVTRACGLRWIDISGHQDPNLSYRDGTDGS